MFEVDSRLELSFWRWYSDVVPLEISDGPLIDKNASSGSDEDACIGDEFDEPRGEDLSDGCGRGGRPFLPGGLKMHGTLW